jgi:hypothetical protein
MKLLISSLLIWIAVTFGSGNNQDSNSEIYRVTLSDGAVLRIGIQSFSGIKRQDREVDAELRTKSDSHIWNTFNLTWVDYAPMKGNYYALVKDRKDRIFVFFTWNGQYCTIDKQTGQVLKRGMGESELRKYDALVPIKLTYGIDLRSVMSREILYDTLSPKERVEWEKEKLKETRLGSAFDRSQVIPGSKLTKHYVIQFDEPISKWHPLYVIAWKANESGSIGFGFKRSIADISIHNHWVKLPSPKRGVYALQPDYSLQQLSLTEKELTQLFLHITRIELRSDERVASLIKQIDQHDLEHWSDKMVAEWNEQELFPPDPFWEQKVDPFLKVVEPPREKSLKSEKHK